MVFTLHVAAELYQRKENLEITFAERPRLGELQARVEQVFQVESNVQRPGGEPLQHVLVRRFEIYDAEKGAWEHLSSCCQLSERCQVYAFQKLCRESNRGNLPQSTSPRAASSPRQQLPVHSAGWERARPLRPSIRTGQGRAIGHVRMSPPGSPREVSGRSLLQEERDRDERRDTLDIDSYRAALREEQILFVAHGLGPSRSA
eukprot:TRINITY_DN13100_c0_g1_i1.p1 TRINITY_DN13100_c0_g1~~TRINITY_DN13100_c0_g1_i1.p1  ORF type:complete len:203 (+),score=30.33 TRINITY_DN13100_c0_g1_i1:57-665(+)